MTAPPHPRTSSPGVRTSGADLAWAWVSRGWFPKELWRRALRMRHPSQLLAFLVGGAVFPPSLSSTLFLWFIATSPESRASPFREVLSALSTLAADPLRAKIERLNCGECY